MDTSELVGRVPAGVLADTAEDKQVKNASLGGTRSDCYLSNAKEMFVDIYTT